MLNRLSRRLIILIRVAAILSFALGLLFVSAFLALRLWLLPNIENYRDDIASAASRAVGERIHIGRIDADWAGIYPRLTLRQVSIYDGQGQPALELERIENTLSWLSLLTFEIRFHSLEIDQPKLGIRRDRNGILYIAGIELNRSQGDNRFSDWLLRQNSISIRNGLIVWEDEARGAPPLLLDSVNFTLVNSGSRHRFGLRAVPPRQLSSPIDVRGDLWGASLGELGKWRGKLFGQLDFVDTSAWKTWFLLPNELIEGRGAARFWVDFDRSSIVQATADVHLHQVRVKLARSLPQLDLRNLHGRIGWTRRDGGFEIETRKLSLATFDGLVLPPLDFLLNSLPASRNEPAQGEIRANLLDLDKLGQLADHFPLPKRARELLNEYQPHGKIRDLQAKWNDEAQKTSFWGKPAAPRPASGLPAHYRVKARLDDLGVSFSQNLASGISGNIDGDESGGSLTVGAHDASFALPKLFAEPLIFETLTLAAKWSFDQGKLGLTLSSASFANSQLSGNAYGSYQAQSSGPGVIDLTGALTRADARQVWRYLPLTLQDSTRQWARQAVAGGGSSDVRLRLKGDLADFPFEDGKRGLFQVTAKIEHGELKYAEGWPQINDIDADLSFHGKKMEVDARQAGIFGARLSRVKAIIPDLNSTDEQLQIEGRAAGPTDEFLKFIDQSPVNDYINGFSEQMHATGGGELKLKLSIPLRRIRDTKVEGSYQFVNDLLQGPGIPNLEQVNATLDFTESSVNCQNATALILGGPATANAATQRDGSLKFSAAGRANPDGQKNPAPWSQYFHGKTDWRAQGAVRKKQSDILIESNMLGMTSTLPPPLDKAAADAMPLRFEKKSIAPGRDLISFSYGNLISAQGLRATDGAVAKIERASVLLHGAAIPPLPELPGIWVSGTIPELNADAWRDLIPQSSAAAATDVAGIDLGIGELTSFGKHFGKLQISARSNQGNWHGTVSGREIEGELDWIAAGHGQVVAKLKRLIIPPTPKDKASDIAAARIAIAKAAERNLPALDINADDFVIHDNHLGHLELLAIQQGTDWRIEKLRISNPDSTLTADGLWQGWAIQPRTQIRLKLDASNIGKLLARFGYPEGVKRGTGKIEGSLSWAGSPQSINFPSLTGNLVLTADKGQFAKIDPGIGKLLGILSLQALPRRITLDFRDVFSEGFAFDEIAGDFTIANGVANTRNLRIVGPAAEVKMTGDIDLGRETQNLKVNVAPQLGGSVGVAGGLIAGPVAGIATWIVSKVLENPLDRIVSYEYNVTGSWDEPTVTKAGAKK